MRRLVEAGIVGIDVPFLRRAAGSLKHALRHAGHHRLVLRERIGRIHAERALIVLRHAHLKIDVQIVRGRQAETQPPGIVLLVVDVLPVIVVHDLAALREELEGTVREQNVLHNRAGQGHRRLDVLFVAVLEPDLAVRIIGGLLGRDLDDAAAGVAAVQRPLRPAQHFDGLDVVELRVIPGGVRQRDVINIGDDGRNIAVGDGRRPPKRGELHDGKAAGGDRQVRYARGKIAERAHPRLAHFVLVHDGNAGRNLLQILPDLVRRNGNLRQHELIVSLRPACPASRRHAQAEQGGCNHFPLLSCHDVNSSNENIPSTVG